MQPERHMTSHRPANKTNWISGNGIWLCVFESGWETRFKHAQPWQKSSYKISLPVVKNEFLRHWQWTEPSSTTWRHAAWSVRTDVSEQPTVSIIKLDESMAIHWPWWWKSRFLRNVGVSTTILNVATPKLLVFLILFSSSDRQLYFRATWPAHPASSLSDISNTTILVTIVSVFHNLTFRNLASYI